MDKEVLTKIREWAESSHSYLSTRTDEVDIENMPVWKIKFENGNIAYCYPEEICKVEHQK